MENICVVQINVSDMDKAVEFYEKLGFLAGGKKLYPDYVELDHIDQDRFHLLLAKCEHSVEDPYPHSSQTLLNFETGDIESKIQEIGSRGVSPLQKTPQEFSEGLFVSYKDPSGNVIELIEFNEPRRAFHQKVKASRD